MLLDRRALLSSIAALALPALTAPARAQGNAASGPKKTLAVGIFESAEILNFTGTGASLSAMLTQALINDGRFVVVERVAFGDIQGEQALGQVGAATPETAARTGQLLGASVLIRGSVTKFAPQASGASFGVGGLPLFGQNRGSALSLNAGQATVEVALRLIDTSTGQVIAASTASGSAPTRGFNIDLYKRDDMRIGTSAFQQSPLGEAADRAIKQAVEQIAAGMSKAPWSALVVENSDGTVFVNAGMDRNIQAGTTLQVYRKVRDLTDPATGAVLETISNRIGAIRIESVRDKVSLAKVIQGDAPARGDVLKLQ